MYEINIIANKPLGKYSPLDSAKDYEGKKKPWELDRVLEFPGFFKLSYILHFFSLVRAFPEILP